MDHPPDFPEDSQQFSPVLGGKGVEDQQTFRDGVSWRGSDCERCLGKLELIV